LNRDFNQEMDIVMQKWRGRLATAIKRLLFAWFIHSTIDLYQFI